MSALELETARGGDRSIVVANPPAGQVWSLAVPGYAVWALSSISFLFTCSAAVATRRLALAVNDGPNSVAIIPTVLDQGASSSIFYSFARGYGEVVADFTIGRISVPMPWLTVSPGMTLTVQQVNLQAGDAFSFVYLRVYETPSTSGRDEPPAPLLVDPLVGAVALGS